MFRRRVVFGLVACLLAVLIVGQTLSQAAQRGQRGGQTSGQRSGRTGGQTGVQRGGAQNSERPQMQRRQFDPQQMQKMMEQRMQRQLRASEQKWKTLGPCVMRVSQLNRQVSGGGGIGGMFGGRRGPMGGPQGAQGRQMTEMDKATQQLQTMLDNDSAKPEDIEKQLTVLRTARANAKKQLVAERQRLQKQVTVRQKAQLVLMGLLD